MTQHGERNVATVQTAATPQHRNVLANCSGPFAATQRRRLQRRNTVGCNDATQTVATAGSSTSQFSDFFDIADLNNWLPVPRERTHTPLRRRLRHESMISSSVRRPLWH
jgi:hypothetical protein